MGFDFFTIRNLAAELNDVTCGCVFSSARSTPRALCLGFSKDRVVGAILGSRGWLGLRRDPALGQPDQPWAGEPFLSGAEVHLAWSDSRDRILWFRLGRADSQGQPSYGLLAFELIHPSFQAYLFSEKSGRVLRRWGEKGRLRLEVGGKYSPPPSRRLLPGADPAEDLVATWQPGSQARRSLASAAVGMDDFVAGEVCVRAGIDPEGESSEEEMRRLWEVAAGLYGQPAQQGGYVWEREGRRFFSGLKPVSFAAQSLPSISEAIALTLALPGPSWTGALSPQLRPLRGAAAKLQRRLQALEADLAEAGAAEQLQRQAALILANLARIPRGSRYVELPDPFSPEGGTTSAELDPDRNPAQTAARLAKKAKRLRRRREILPTQIRMVRTQLQEVKDLLDQVPPYPADIECWLKENGMSNTQNCPEEAREGGGRSTHPRRYRTSTGWSVWAGRNNAENDQLSHRLAAQNDYWFHAHGYPGSHVVLRREGRKEEPSAQTLREAAGVAAYWSKGKTAKKIAVVYTLVKYVSKPRGGAPGQAVLKREKSILVEPKLLAEEDAGHKIA